MNESQMDVEVGLVMLNFLTRLEETLRHATCTCRKIQPRVGNKKDSIDVQYKVVQYSGILNRSQ